MHTAVPGDRGAGTFLFATGEQWLWSILAGTAAALFAAPFYSQVSAWIGATITIMGILACHMAFTFRSFPPWPHLVGIFAGIQMVLMAWLAWYYPTNPEKDIGQRTGIYLSYAGPCWITFVFGWFAALAKLSVEKTDEKNRELGPNLNTRRFLDTCMVAGIGCQVAGRSLDIAALQFALVLLANLRFVGGAGWLMVRAKGWRWRVGLLLFLEISGATKTTMFGDLAMWSLALLPLYLYRSSLRPRAVFAVLLLCCAAFVAMDIAKTRYRETAESGAMEPISLFGLPLRQAGLDKLLVWFWYLADAAVRTVTFQLSDAEISHLIERQSHGWIVNQVMLRVPHFEPYANGQTIWVALEAAALPRFLAPDKYRAGGEYFERFTGMSLIDPDTGARNTSMNLGFSGEFYANFGKLGGILTSGLFGLLSGLVLRWFYRKSFRSVLWLAFFPFVFLWGMKAEEGIGEILNWVVKASVVVAVILWLSPARQELAMSRPTKRQRPRQSRPKAACQ
ncbi:MAG: hypothetical protein WCQ21_25085 [Verrucomicrobiota bacterium]